MKRKDVFIYAEIDICWETEKKEIGKQNVKYIDKQLNMPKKKVEKFSKKLKSKYVNRWVWSTKRYKTYYVEKVLEEIFENFGDKRGILQKIKKELDARIAIDIIIEMKKNQTPALVIDEKMIEFVKDIGGYIDVDMYIT